MNRPSPDWTGLPEASAAFVPFVPFDKGRPVPSPEDYAAAEAFVTEFYYNAKRPYCPTWLAYRRAGIVESIARIEMQKRLEAEHRAQFAPRKEMAA